MRQTSLLVAACLAGLLSAPGASAQTAGNPPPHIIISPPAFPAATTGDPVSLAPPTDLSAPATGWANAGQHQFGPTYELYVPVEIKSNTPDVERSWTAAAAPLNGGGHTPAGQACVADADCAAPMGCFNRADSGQVPVKECALPPNR